MIEKDISAAVATMLLSDKNAVKRSIIDAVKERTHIQLCDRSQCRIKEPLVVRAFKNADLYSRSAKTESSISM